VPAAALDEHRAAKQAVFQAMLQVPWVAGEGIPDSPTDGTEYAAMLEAGVCAEVHAVVDSVQQSLVQVCFSCLCMQVRCSVPAAAFGPSAARQTCDSHQRQLGSLMLWS
jgi:hypothetical protein